MFAGMGMRFQTGSEMRMKFEMIGSWNGNYLLRMEGNVSIDCIAAQSAGYRADIVGATPIQVYTGAEYATNALCHCALARHYTT